MKIRSLAFAERDTYDPYLHRGELMDRFHRLANVVTDYAVNIALGSLLLLTYSIT